MRISDFWIEAIEALVDPRPPERAVDRRAAWEERQEYRERRRNPIQKMIERHEQHPSTQNRQIFYQQLLDQGFEKEFLYFSIDGRSSVPLVPSPIDIDEGTVGIFQRHRAGMSDYLTIVIPGKFREIVPNSRVIVQLKRNDIGPIQKLGEITFQQYLDRHPRATALINLVGPWGGRAAKSPGVDETVQPRQAKKACL